MLGVEYQDVYSEEMQQNIAKEFTRLKELCYLDHAGATLYSENQMRAVSEDLCSNVYGNPHSLSTSSRYATDVVDQARYRILRHFNASPEDYSVIFTSGATSALKLLAESFNWTGGTSTSDNTAIIDSSGAHRNGDISSDETQENSYDGSPGAFVYLQDNHTSVLGMRELAAEKGASIRCVTNDEAFEIFSGENSVQETSPVYSGNSIFAYPGQCNFSGVKYPLAWIDKLRNGALDRTSRSKWFCLLDAAALAGTSPLDLSTASPDFVCVSFYKMFGYPTGLGALLVRSESAAVLDRVYFGGGTVSISLSSSRFHVPRPVLHDRFEDGTISFLSVVGLRHGFELLSRLTGEMSCVSQHCLGLARLVHRHLVSLRHGNGAPAAIVYADTDYCDLAAQGGIVNFNLLRDDGQTVGFVEVLNMANLYDIQLRTGCFCNPGACQRHLGLSEQELRGHFQAGHVCGDEKDLIEGRPTGSIRVSFGFMSTKHDADRLLAMISTCFITGQASFRVPEWWDSFQNSYRIKFRDAIGSGDAVDRSSKNNANDDNRCMLHLSRNMQQKNGDSSVDEHGPRRDELSHDVKSTKRNMNKNQEESNGLDLSGDISKHDNCTSKTLVLENSVHDDKQLDQVQLKHIFVYPVKSCGALSVDRWELGPRGLALDREWMVVTAAGSALTQKTEPKLCLVAPDIDLKRQTLTLNFPGLASLSLPLRPPPSGPTSFAPLCDSKVCGDRVQGWDCGPEAASWLQQALLRDGLRLIRQWGRDAKKKTRDGAPLSLSNQAQYLLLSVESVAWLADRLPVDADRSPANLTLRFRGNLVVKGTHPFAEYEWQEVRIGSNLFQSQGPCRRCQVICVDQVTGEKTREPLQTIAATGETRFGAYLLRVGGSASICVGDAVTPSLASAGIV